MKAFNRLIWDNFKSTQMAESDSKYENAGGKVGSLC